MTSLDTQIQKAYEQENMTPEQISSDQSLDLAAVKAKLMQVSSKYRKDCNSLDLEDETLNFTNDELRSVNRVILEAAIGAEHSDGSVDYKTRLQAAMYVRDDKKGRKELVKSVQNAPFLNILTINNAIQVARESASRIKDRVVQESQKLIEA